MVKLKLQWKIFGFLLGFCVLLLGVLWLFQTVFLSQMYQFIRKNEMDKAIILVEKNINSSKLQDVLDELEVTKQIIVKPTKEFAMPIRPLPDEYKPRHPQAITKVQEFDLADGRNISLTFYGIVTPVEATVSTLQMQLYIITGIMIFLATLLAIIISKYIANPIARINQSAKVLAKGNYDIKFQGKGFLEIRELSDTLNHAAMELSQVEGLRRELMANVSHDLRTPLSLIYSYGEMMHDFPHEVTPEQSQMIMDEAKRLTSLVNDMLDVSSMERSMIKLNKAHYNLTESIRNTMSRIRELLKSEGFDLEFQYNEEVYLMADEIKITQAFYNLLLNAINYSDNYKRVLVRQVRIDHLVRIEVVDQGKGIGKSDLPYIWDRYYQIDKKNKRKRLGTGLGLSIVKKIIESHEGQYGVVSQEGKGSMFWFQLEVNNLKHQGFP